MWATFAYFLDVHHLWRAVSIAARPPDCSENQGDWVGEGERGIDKGIDMDWRRTPEGIIISPSRALI